MPPSKSSGTQGDRVLTLEITQASMVDRLDKFENKIDTMETKNESRHTEIINMFGTMKEYIDKKYVKKETFTVAVSVLGVVATLIGVITRAVNK